MLLEGKKAVVTGGTRGIGFAVVETFLKNGASVALFGSRQETVDKALAKLKAENPDWDVMGLAPDLTDYAAVEAAMAKVTEAFGRIDILVNNAGISAREPLYQYDPAAFKNIMDLNVTAVFNGCRAVYRQRYNFHHRNTGNQRERQKKSPLLLLIQGLAQPCKESHKAQNKKIDGG